MSLMRCILVKDNKYQVRVLTRDAHNARAQKLASLPGVELVQGSFANEGTLREGLRGCDGAVNTLCAFYMLEKFGFLEPGEYDWEKGELSLASGGYDPKFRCSHYDRKGKVGGMALLTDDGRIKYL
jgi:hypothetical protein